MAARRTSLLEIPTFWSVLFFCRRLEVVSRCLIPWLEILWGRGNLSVGPPWVYFEGLCEAHSHD